LCTLQAAGIAGIRTLLVFMPGMMQLAHGAKGGDLSQARFVSLVPSAQGSEGFAESMMQQWRLI